MHYKFRKNKIRDDAFYVISTVFFNLKINNNEYLLNGSGVKNERFFKRSKIFFLMPEINENLLR